jgi:hypothetical protein
MKKNLTLFFAALLVVTVTSCNNVLDKKINKDTFSQDMQEIIKKDSDKYSSQDFATLMLAAGVSKMVDVQYLKGTYRQALDSIKTGREKAKADSIQKAQKYQAELKVFSDKVATLTKAIDLKVIGKGSEPVNDYDESFLLHTALQTGHRSRSHLSRDRWLLLTWQVTRLHR